MIQLLFLIWNQCLRIWHFRVEEVLEQKKHKKISSPKRKFRIFVPDFLQDREHLIYRRKQWAVKVEAPVEDFPSRDTKVQTDLGPLAMIPIVVNADYSKKRIQYIL